MTWQLLIIISVVFNSISVLLQRVLLKEETSDPLAFSIIFQLLTGVLIGLFGYSIGQMRFPNITGLITNLILMTFFYAVGNLFVFKALKHTEASKFIIIFSSRALFSVIASSIILKEFLTAKHWLGAVLILSGVLLINFTKKSISFGKKEIFALFAAISFGLANTNDRFLLGSFNVYPYVFLAFIVPALFLFFVRPQAISQMKVFKSRKVFGKMILLCVFYAISAITFFSALQMASNSSRVVVANLVVVVITVILSIIFLKERDAIGRKILGSISSFIGLLLVS